MTRKHKQIFYDITVHIPEVQNCMSGKNEDMVIVVINSMGFILGKDYFRQYPIAESMVVDLAFVNEQVAIEVDGQNHKSKKQKIKDNARDNFLQFNNWVIIRIPEEKFFGYKKVYYKNLIREVVKERQKQYQSGKLHKIDIKPIED